MAGITANYSRRQTETWETNAGKPWDTADHPTRTILDFFARARHPDDLQTGQTIRVRLAASAMKVPSLSKGD
jgi:hypothetical protein